jgi:hypothetical protein
MDIVEHVKEVEGMEIVLSQEKEGGGERTPFKADDHTDSEH